MYLFGASGHGKVIVDLIKTSTKYQVEGFFDDKPIVDEVLNLPVHRYKNQNLIKEKIIISIGNNKFRKLIADRIDAKYIKAIHKMAFVSEFSSIDVGTVIMCNAIVNTSVVIGKHCIVNSGAVIEHDSVLSDFVHVSPNASIAGDVTIGEGAHVGIGAQVIQGIKIGKWSVIGAGSVVVKDVPDYAVVVGNPARIIKYKENE